MGSATASPWIVRASAGKPPPADADASAPPPPPPPPRLSLVCFAPAGASAASAFFGWDQALPPEVEVLPIELPGRAGRIKEPPLDDMRALVAALLHPDSGVLPALRARPYALFGHSMGAWVAFELARALAAAGGPLPLKLYVSANRSPALAGVQHDVDPTAMHLLGGRPPDFWAAMERRYGPNRHLEHPAIRRLLLPTLLADFRLIETWRPLGGAAAPAATHGGCAPPASCDSGGAADPAGELQGSRPRQQPGAADEGSGLLPPNELTVPCPLAALGALGDVRYTREQLGAWRHCAPAAASPASGGYEERWFEGGHSYITAEGPGRSALLEWLGGDLLRLAAQHSAAEAPPLQAPAAPPDDRPSAENGAPAEQEAAVQAAAYAEAALHGSCSAHAGLREAPVHELAAQEAAGEGDDEAQQPTQAPASGAGSPAPEQQHAAAVVLQPVPDTFRAPSYEEVVRLQAAPLKQQPAATPASRWPACLACCWC